MREEQHTYAACEKHIGSYHADFNRVKEQREEHAKQMEALKKQVADSDELIARLREEQQQIKRDLTTIQERADSVKYERAQLHKSKRKLNSSRSINNCFSCSKSLQRTCNGKLRRFPEINRTNCPCMANKRYRWFMRCALSMPALICTICRAVH